MPRSLQIPSVRADTRTGEAVFYDSLVDRLQGFTQRQFQRVGNVVERRSEKAGLEAALAGEFELKPDTTVANRAFNNGALRGYAAETITDIVQRMPEIEAEALQPADDGLSSVERFEAKSKGYRDALLAEMPPELVPELQPYLDRQIAAAGGRIQAKHMADSKAREKAATTVALEKISDQQARALVDGDVEMATLAESLYVNMLNAAVGDLTFTEAEAIDMIGAQLDRANQSLLLGQYEAAAEAGNALTFLENFRSNPPKDLSPEEHQTILGKMLNRLADQHRIEDTQQELDDDTRKERHRIGEQIATLAMLRGELGPEMLEEMVANDELDPGIVSRFEERSHSLGPSFDNENIKLMYRIAPETFTEQEILDEPTLTSATKADLIELREETVGDLEDWRNTQQGTEAARRIKNELGIPDGIAIANMTQQAVKEAGQALTEFYETVDSLPLEERRAKAVEVAEDVIARIRDQKNRDSAARKRRKLDALRREDTSCMGGFELKRHEDEIARFERQLKELTDAE